MDPYRIFQRLYVVVCRRSGRITGYLTYAFVEVDHYTDMYHDLYVHKMIYDDPETLQQFMTFFRLSDRSDRPGADFVHGRISAYDVHKP